MATTLLGIGEGTLADVAGGYENTVECHRQLYDAFERGANREPQLRAHRDFVDRHDHGYGDRAFHHMWRLIVETLPASFKFLEIGVYKGQVISLMALLGRLLGKTAQIYGVTPLSSAGDRYSRHDECDYVAAIRRIHAEFDLSMERTTLIRGRSQDQRVVQLAQRYGPFDALYVDGCHELEAVVSDLMLYPPMLRHGGLLVVDDAGRMVNLPEGLYRGLRAVSAATHRIIEEDPAFEVLFSCGHNRVFRKIGTPTVGGRQA
ncbi:MAG: class I SAM-dependent methyltransferase [Planctomycetota bacterium]